MNRGIYMMIETMIIVVSMLVIGMLISKACKNSKEPTINNHYGDVNNNTNSNNVTNSHNTTTDSHTDNRADNRHHITNELSEKDEILKEIAKLINDVEKEREINALLKANEDLINRYKK
jgi:hypothetical protein